MEQISTIHFCQAAKLSRQAGPPLEDLHPDGPKARHALKIKSDHL
jgi:hypothetical protein